MGNNEKYMLSSHCKQALSIIEQCTDDFMFIFDLTRDTFQISESVCNLFKLNSCVFNDARNTLSRYIYRDDLLCVRNEFDRICKTNDDNLDLEFRCVSSEGNTIWVSTRAKIISDNIADEHYMVGRIAQLDKQNKYDNITGIYCENVLEREYKLLDLGKPVNGFILIIGIDNLREVNEKYGTKMGDVILKNVCGCICSCIESKKNLYRLKGDEFAYFCAQPNDNAISAKELYKRIRKAVDKSIVDLGYNIFYTISGGAVYFDSLVDSFDTVMRNLRFSLHCAKIRGKNTYVEFSEEDYCNYIKKLDIQEKLRYSIQNNFKGFDVYYQPIVKTAGGTISGAEALIRWDSIDYGYMSPMEFVPLLEESSLIIPLGKWIIEQAVIQCVEWVKLIPDFVMNINLSFVQILKSDVLKDAVNCIDKYGLSHEHIVFEITESGIMESSEMVRNVLSSFHRNSFVLAIDDFGTGYSNLRYIKEKKFGIIKIDRTFVKNVQESSENFTLIKYIIDLAHSFKLKVCVEGVETKEELKYIKMLMPDCIQGFFFGKPVKKDKFTKNYI